VSKSVIMEVIAPVTNEKATTPRSIRKMQNILSPVLLAEISPYPTVTIVVTQKYMNVK